MNKKLVTVLFFLSGASALIYEILWTRLFSFVLGHTYLAITIIVASFMFGLFLGSWLIGFFLEKCKNELKWYAYLELIIGAYALLLLFSFTLTHAVFDGLYATLGRVELLHSLGKFLATMLLIVIPTSAMGATFPLIVQYFTKRKKYFGDNVSLFYSVNTLGGALGALAGGFYVIEHFGVRSGLAATAGISIVIGIIVLVLLQISRTEAPPSEQGERKQSQDGNKSSVKRTEGGDKLLYLSAAGLAGFAALSYEIIWTRGLKFLIHNSTYSLSVILFVFLVGIAAGSIVAKKIIRKNPNLQYVYGILQIAMGLLAIFSIYLLYSFSYSDFFQENIVEIIYDYSYTWVWAIAIYALICSILFLAPSIIMGILFPLINELSFKKVIRKTGKTVSSVYAVNTIGAIAGSLGAGFFLLPSFGIKTSILVISVINLLLGIVFVLKAKFRIFSTFSVGAALFFVVLNLSFDGQYLLGRKETRQDRVLFYKEGLMSTVKVYEQNRRLHMSIDGIRIASNQLTLLKKEKLIAHLPFFVKPDIRNVLAVGLASGISVGAMALHNNVEQIDCVELVRSVFPAASYFSGSNYDIFNNEKINFIYDDVYSFLKHNDGKYDLISSDGKLGPLYSGNTVMLSTDYYELCKTRMKEDGLFIQWAPIITPHNELRVMLESLKRSFKSVSLFYFYPSDIFMLASDTPIILDKGNMDTVLSDRNIRRELERFNIRDSFSILSSYMGVYESSPNEAIRTNSFDRPILEFEFMRDWKKSRRWEGGYRAKNLEYMVENYEKTDLSFLFGVFKNVDKPTIENIYKASMLFFRGGITFFKTGNFRKSFQEYTKFKESVRF